jgi:hypothetical protein
VRFAFERRDVLDSDIMQVTGDAPAFIVLRAQG